jgi:hypothetical protein
MGDVGMNMASQPKHDAPNFAEIVPSYQWPYRLTVFLNPGDLSAKDFEWIVSTVGGEGLLELVASALEYHQARIEATKLAGTDKGQPSTGRALTYGHSVDMTPMLIDISIDPYRVSVERLRAAWPQIVSDLSRAIVVNEKYRRQVAEAASEDSQ